MSQAMAEHAAEQSIQGKVDPIFGTASHGKLGMWIFLLTDGMGFAGLLIALGIVRTAAPVWPPNPEVDHLGIPFTAIMTFILICSSVTMVLALSGAQEGNRKALVGWLSATVLGGLFFLCGQVYEYSHLIREGFTLSADHMSSTFYVITSYHGAHVLTGVIYLSVVLVKSLKAPLTKSHASFVEVAGLFWHFVDLVWILVFTIVYLIPSNPGVH